MALSYDLISQFAKLATGDKKVSTEATVYGTIKVDEHGDKYVQPDGSDQLIPLAKSEDLSDGIASSANANEDERVSVLIKNHTATVTGNISSPAARTGDVEAIQEFDILIGKQVQANEAYFKKLIADEVTLGKLTAAEANIIQLLAKSAEIDELLAGKITVTDLIAKKIDADVVIADKALVDSLKASNIDVLGLIADKAVIGKLVADKADLNSVEAKNAYLKFANIDFSNIGEAAIEKLFSDSGIIGDLIMSDGKVTGTLVGVTIKGDLIEGNTVVADKLVVRGEDGLYYKLNMLGIGSGVTTRYIKADAVIDPAPAGTIIEGAITTTLEPVYEYTDSEGNPAYYTVVDDICYEVGLSSSDIEIKQTDYNSLNGSVIVAKSITAEKVSVDDLVAFGATIGGFHITDSALYSGVKESVDNTTRGIYLDKYGQVAFGDSTNYVKFYETSNGEHKLAIAADTITFSSGGNKKDVETAISEQKERIDAVGDAQSHFESKVNKQITFSGDNAITIGGSSGITLIVDNDNGIIFAKYVSDESNGDIGYAEVESITTMYQLGTSNTELPTGLWLDKVPKIQNGESLWIRTTTTYRPSNSQTSSENVTKTVYRVAFGQWDGNDFYTGNIVVRTEEQARFGNFAYVPRSDGSLMFLKVGG